MGPKCSELGTRGQMGRARTNLAVGPAGWGPSGRRFKSCLPDVDKRFRPVCNHSGMADLYGVETKRLIQQVKRNLKRFPGDFMSQLTKAERRL
jgi:hypothetical protein